MDVLRVEVLFVDYTHNIQYNLITHIINRKVYKYKHKPLCLFGNWKERRICLPVNI